MHRSNFNFNKTRQQFIAILHKFSYFKFNRLKIKNNKNKYLTRYLIAFLINYHYSIVTVILVNQNIE